jgi:hypothetical protein
VGTFRPLTYEELDKLREATSGVRKSRAARGRRMASKGRKPTGAKIKRPKEVFKPVTGAIIGGDDIAPPRKARPVKKRPAKKRPLRKERGGRP